MLCSYSLTAMVFRVRAKGALQLLINRYGFAQVPERVSTKSFVVLIIGNSKSFHLGAQGTFNPIYRLLFLCLFVGVSRANPTSRVNPSINDERSYILLPSAKCPVRRSDSTWNFL